MIIPFEMKFETLWHVRSAWVTSLHIFLHIYKLFLLLYRLSPSGGDAD